LTLYLARLDLIETQMESLNQMIAEAMKAYQEAVVRLAELPGLGVDSAQQIIAEIGPKAAAFPSAAQLASWVGVCPGRQESAGVSSSDRSAKGNRSMRRLLNQLAHAAVKKEDCQLQIVFRRLASRLGYAKAVWAIAHRLCRLIWKVLHEGVTYVELWSHTDSHRIETKTTEIGNPTQRARISSATYPDHAGPRRGLIFEGVGG
jgi:transposase